MKSKSSKISFFLFTVVCLTVIMMIAGACNNSGPKEKQTRQTVQKSDSLYYTCPMHPEVHSSKPGNCPKCGMKMVRSDEIKK